MRRIFLFLLMMLILGVLSACNFAAEDKADEGETDTFTGTIDRIEGQIAIVAIETGSILKSGSEVTVDLSVAEDTTFHVGDTVKVGYDGEVRESHPLGIHTTSVEIWKNSEEEQK